MKGMKALLAMAIALPMLSYAEQEPLRIRNGHTNYESQQKQRTNVDPYGHPTGNPSFYSPTSHNYLVNLGVDFTYWNVRIDGHSYLGTGLRIQPNSENTKGKIYEVNPKWEPGFRVALGLIFPERGWDISGRYTYLDYDHSGSTSDLTQGGRTTQSLTPGNGNSFRELAPTSASASANFNLNEIGLELGRKFYNSEYLALRFFTGLQGLWTSSDFKVKYYYNPPTSATLLQIDHTDVTGPAIYKLNGSSWAIGPIMGFETSWYLYKELSIFGRFNYMLTYVNEDNHYKVDVEDIGSPTTNVENVSNHDTYFLHNFSQIQLGLVLDTWLSDHAYLLTLKLLYELNSWNSINPSGGTGNLGGFGVHAHGLTAGASFAF